MRIAIPAANGRLCAHFGHCEQFIILDVDESGNVAAVQNQDPPPHEPGALPAWLRSQNVDHIIAGGMGRRAQDLFTEYGITVTTGAPLLAPEVLARELVNGTLSTGGNLCDH